MVNCPQRERLIIPEGEIWCRERVPEFTLSCWTGLYLAVPILLIRYRLLGVLGKNGLKRAAFFPPVCGAEKTAFIIYEITMTLLFLYLPFLSIKVGTLWFHAGLLVFVLGTILDAKATLDFTHTSAKGISSSGLYRISRNPMYVAFFICLMGCGILTASWLYLVILAIFQISSHWIILSEERWCLQESGPEYSRYMERVGRYLGGKWSDWR